MEASTSSAGFENQSTCCQREEDAAVKSEQDSVKSEQEAAASSASSEASDNSNNSCYEKGKRPTRRSKRKVEPKSYAEDVDIIGDYNYNFRRSSLVNRVQSERKRKEPKLPKPKAKPPPLSKYRRKAANSRERGRMVEINVAFEMLKDVLPEIEVCPASKMTKITTLRLAMNYISALRQTLGYEDDLNSDASSTRPSSLSSGEEDMCQSPSSFGDHSPFGEHSPSSFDDILSSEHIASNDLDLDLPSGLLLS